MPCLCGGQVLHVPRFARRSAGWLFGILSAAGVLLGLPALAQTAPPVVGIVQVPVEEVSPSSEFVGRVEAVNAVDIRARVEGFLEARPFDEGQAVQQGQLLFIIEKAAYEIALAAAQAGLAGAEATLRDAEGRLERNRELSRTQTVSRATLEEVQAARDTAHANVMAAEASVRQAGLNLGYTSIPAPITGRIGRSAFAVGALVGPSSGSLARIVQMDPIRVVFSVSDRTILALRSGPGEPSKEELAARFVPRLQLSTGEAYPFPGTIEFLGNEVDPQTGTVPVRARFPNPQSILVPGQFVTVSVGAAVSVSRPVVPAGAVQQDRQGKFVLLVGDDDRVELRRIRVSRQVGQNWIVEEGLKGGEKLIAQGFQNASPGAAVRPVGLAEDAAGAAPR